MEAPLRQMLDRRPTLVVGAGLVIGLTAWGHPANLLALPVFLFWLTRPVGRWLFASAVLLGLVLAPAPVSSIVSRQFERGIGTIRQTPHSTPFGSSFRVELDGRLWEATSRDCPTLNLGDRVRIEGVGLPLREGSERYLLLHGVTGRLNVGRLEPDAPGPWVWRWAGEWRRSFSAFCARTLPPAAAPLAQALCFDLNGELDPHTTDLLRKTGTIHVVSASGLHVFLIAAALTTLLSRLPLPRSAQLGVVGCALLLYAGATGLNPPVVRAALMSAFGLSAYLFRRERDPLSALGLAAVAYLLWDPRQVYDPGFQLSFLTVGAMALFLPPQLGSKAAAKEKLLAALRVSGVAWIASTPIVAYHFGTVSFAALPANVLIALPVSAAAVSALVAHALSAFVPALGAMMLTWATGPMVGWVLFSVEWLGGLPLASVEVPAFSAYWLPLLYGLLLLTWRQRIARPN